MKNKKKHVSYSPFTYLKKRLMAFFILTSCIIFSPLYGQNEQSWLTLGEQTTNFNEIKAAFYKDNAEKIEQYQQDMADLASGKIKEIPKGKYANLKQFMRMAQWYEPRVAETQGDMRVIGEATNRAQLQAKKALQTRAANWKILGPINQSAALSGNGRVNSIRVDPTNPNVLYACSPGSQLFKSDNGGTSWRSISDDIPGIGITDVAIDSTAPNTLYALTGDGDRAIYHPYSTGLYKTTDGGATWTPTGLTYTQSNSISLTTVVIHPKDPNILLVAGTNGVYRSTDGGANFVRTSTVSVRELVFKPSDPSIVFAGSKTGGSFLRSTDNGLSWLKITSGLPTTDVARYSISVSPIHPDYVFTLATNAAHGMKGFYRSTDGGLNFTLMSTTPNITSTQGWYDLAIAAHPTDTNVVYAGGVSLYKSSNGGATWATTGTGVHVDYHCLTFSGTTLYVSNDGGVYKNINQSTFWTNISSNLSIAQLYGLGQSQTNENLIISGHQDNGTNLTSDNTTWRQVSGGDGMISFIDRSNDSIMYCTFQNGVLRRSTNKGNSFTTIYTVPNGNWVTPFVQDPQIATTLYTGGRQVLKSTNRGTKWDSISNFTNANVRWIDIDRNDNQIIYAMTANKLYKTTQGGTIWADISTGLPTGSLQHVHIDVNNSNNIYISVASYAGNAVFLSKNGGTSWTNISTGLPRVPANTILTQLGASGEIYCGTDVGVYYRDSSATTWQAFQTGMPNVPVRDLEIFYPTGKIRAATFGRSIWESFLNTFAPACMSANTPSVSNVSVTGATVAWATALGATSYTLEYKTADSTNWVVLKGISGTSFNLTGLASSVLYNLRVTSVCSETVSANPSTISSFTPFCIAPSPPSVSNIKTTEADVEWPLINGVINYQLEYKKADSTVWTVIKNITDLGYALTGLNMGTTYSVRLFNSCTPTISSSPSNITDFTTVCPVSPLLSLSNIMSTEVSLSWAAVSGISTYTLEYKLALATVWIAIKDINTTTYTLTGLNVGTRYDVRVVTTCPSVSNASPSERFLTSLNTALSDNDLSEKFTLQLYPNPAFNNVNLEINTLIQGQYVIDFYNALGSKIFTQKSYMKEGKNVLSVSTQSFSTGMYLVRMGMGQDFIVKKLVIL